MLRSQVLDGLLMAESMQFRKSPEGAQCSIQVKVQFSPCIEGSCKEGNCPKLPIASVGMTLLVTHIFIRAGKCLLKQAVSNCSCSFFSPINVLPHIEDDKEMPQSDLNYFLKANSAL